MNIYQTKRFTCTEMIVTICTEHFLNKSASITFIPALPYFICISTVANNVSRVVLIPFLSAVEI